MSNTVDRRVVEMQFDNKEFEQNIQTSVKSLDQLKKSLNLEESAKGLEGLEKAGKSFNLDSLVKAAEVVTDRFSIMGRIGTQVLNRITDAAINAAMKIKNMIAEFTTVPIKTGFAEYETQINAIQTILANTSDAMDKAGYSNQQRIDIVNQKLDELNRYADKTIYNFTEMTRNIGTFTAAGVELDTAVASIQGIANLAAVSGSTSEQASRAMYQLSQAISTGTVKLMDWNSVVNAGMGGAVFQKALIRTAKNMGVVGEKAKASFDALVAGNMSFRDSLSDGWLTSDILTATLEQISWDFETLAKSMGKSVEEVKELKKADLLAAGYTSAEVDEIIRLAEMATDAATKVKTFTQLFDTLKEAAQSGWTQTWEYIIGDFEEAKALLTEISQHFGKIIDASSDARNKVVKEWKDLGGRDELIAGFWNIVTAIENVAGKISGAIHKIFPPKTGEDLYNITKRFREVTESIKNFTENIGNVNLIDAAIDGFRKTVEKFKGVFNKNLGSGLQGFLKRVSESRKMLTGSVLDSKYIQKWTGELKNSLSSSEHFQEICDKIKTSFGNGKDGITQKLKEFGDIVKTAFGGEGDTLTQIRKFSSEMRQAISEVFSNGLDFKLDGSAFSSMKGKFSVFGEMFSGWFDGIQESMAQKWESAKEKMRQFFSESLPNFFNDIFGDGQVQASAAQAFSAMAEVVPQMGKSVSDALSSEEMTSRFGNISNVWGKIVEGLKTVYRAAEKVDWDRVLTLAYQISRVITAFYQASAARSVKKGLTNFGNSFEAFGKSFETISKAIGAFGNATAGGFRDGLKGLGESLVDFGKQMSKPKKVIQESIGTTILKIAAAIGVLTLAVYVLAGMKEDDIKKGMFVLGVMAAGLLTVTGIFKLINTNTRPLLQLSVALALLVVPIKMFAAMDDGKIAKGLLTLGLLFTEIAVFMRLAGSGFQYKTAFLSMSIAVTILVGVVKQLGKMDTETAMKGMFGLGVILTELAVFMRVAGKGFENKTAFLGISICIGILAGVVKKLGAMRTGEAAQGLIGISVLLTELAIFMRVAGKGFKNASSLLAISVGLNVLVLAVKNLAKMNGLNMAKALIGMEVLFLELSAFMKKTNATKVSGLIAMAVAVNLLVVAMKSIARMKTGDLLKGVLGLGGVMAAFGILLQSVNHIKIGSAIATLVVLGGTLAMFYYAFREVQNMDTTKILEFAESMSMTMLAMSASMKIISMIPIAGAVKGLAGFAILIAGVGGIVVALGALQQEWAGLEGFLESGGVVMQKLGDALGQFIGGIGAGIMSGLKLPDMANDLTQFSENLKPFLDNVKGIDKSAKEGVKNLSAIITSISGAEFLNAVSSWVAGDNTVTLFVKDVKELAVGLGDFAQTVSTSFKDVSKSEISKVINAADGLTDLVKSVPWESPKWAAAVIGQRNVEKFVNDVVGTEGQNGFLDALKKYSETISGFSVAVSKSDIKNSTTAAEGMIELLNSLPNEGGWVQKITGVPNMGGFSEKVGPFAEAMMSYANHLAGFKSTVSDNDISSSTNAAKGLVELINAMPEEGGFFQKITGIPNLNSLSEKVAGFASAMKEYAANLSGFKSDVSEQDISSSTNAAKGIIELVNVLPKEGGVWQELTGIPDLTSFAEKVPGFAIGMKAYAEGISGFAGTIQEGDTEAAINIAESINDFIGSLQRTGGLWQKITGSKDLDNFSVTIVTLGTAIRDYVSSVGGLTTDQATAAITILSDFGTTFAEFATGVTGIKGFKIESIQNFLNSFTELQIPEFDAAGMSAAEAYLSSINEAIQNGETVFITTVNAFALAGVCGAKETYQDWYDAGSYLGQGLANGISAMASTISSNARNAAAGAIRSIQVTWSVHSPSKVGEDLGMNFDLGIGNGIAGYARVISSQAAEMADSVVDSAKTMFYGDGSTIFDHIDPNPTIRPVMDLSSIESGIGTINTMLGRSSDFGSDMFRGRNFNIGAGSLKFEGSKIAGGFNNKDVVSELKTLEERFDAMNEALSNMKMVLDSGELVGRTSASMDKQFGKLEMRRGRGN